MYCFIRGIFSPLFPGPFASNFTELFISVSLLVFKLMLKHFIAIRQDYQIKHLITDP